MNLENQKVLGVNELHVTDSLHAPLLNLKLSVTSNTVVPSTNQLIISVDRTSKNNSYTEDKRDYVFELSNALNLGETFEIKPEFNADIKMQASVTRNSEKEIVTYIPIVLFEGENYIYTNYSNISLEIEYPKDTEFNRHYLSSSLYYIHRENADGDFSLDDIYFKDAFTEVEDGIDLSVRHINAKCISSVNNNFYLDADGNLTVKTITASNQEITPTLSDIFSAIYPVGSIYMSVNNTDPEKLFGGKWQSWGAGRCPVGVDTSQSEFSTIEKTGGENTHKLTASEMPAHNHTVSSGNHTHTYTGYINVTATTATTYQCIAHKRYTADGTNTPASMNSSGAHSHTVSNTGSGNAHNNLQPYITCYMWKRIS